MRLTRYASNVSGIADLREAAVVSTVNAGTTTSQTPVDLSFAWPTIWADVGGRVEARKFGPEAGQRFFGLAGGALARSSA